MRFHRNAKLGLAGRRELALSVGVLGPGVDAAVNT